MKILVVDVGGTSVKLLATGYTAPLRIPSSPALGPAEMVAAVRAATAAWDYDAVSIGYPGPVRGGLPARDPHNLGPGWVGFDFAAAFGRPVKIANDAGMQALGSYEGGHMLFLGFGTGLGSALVVDGVLTALELAHLPYRHGRTFEDYVGARGLERMGPQRWRRHVDRVTRMLMQAMNADYTVVGGGNAKRLRDLPPNVRRGSNAKAFVGGFRLWRGLGDSAAER
ncbi:MAG TPA: ROK family protein [Gemmatimonadaceae bacterium]|nr:ROK family protein [Gemmatimonadaceae bacterium]